MRKQQFKYKKIINLIHETIKVDDIKNNTYLHDVDVGYI
jgi:hypothetical protein